MNSMRKTADDEAESPLDVAGLCRVFRAQLAACLTESAGGRAGLFAASADEVEPWPEAEKLRALAVAIHGLTAQLRLDLEDARVVDEYLDLCSMHGESHPGEARLARQFLEHLETGAA